VFTQVPVEPDAETARRWAMEELSKPAYQEHGPSWITRVWEWLGRLLDHLFSFDLGGNVIAAIVVAVLIVGLIILAVRLTAGPVGRAFRNRRTHSVFEDDSRTSAQMRAAANAASERGEWDLAVLERFRAIIRSLEERDLISDRPGVTADEAALEAGGRFPDVVMEMMAGANLFDAVRYGHGVATRQDDEALRRLDASLSGRTLLSAVTP
jgi:hypothetical protein